MLRAGDGADHAKDGWMSLADGGTVCTRQCTHAYKHVAAAF